LISQLDLGTACYYGIIWPSLDFWLILVAVGQLRLLSLDLLCFLALIPWDCVSLLVKTLVLPASLADLCPGSLSLVKQPVFAVSGNSESRVAP